MKIKLQWKGKGAPVEAEVLEITLWKGVLVRDPDDPKNEIWCSMKSGWQTKTLRGRYGEPREGWVADRDDIAACRDLGHCSCPGGKHRLVKARAGNWVCNGCVKPRKDE